LEAVKSTWPVFASPLPAIATPWEPLIDPFNCNEDPELKKVISFVPEFPVIVLLTIAVPELFPSAR
jgi:hypothetical protein